MKLVIRLIFKICPWVTQHNCPQNPRKVAVIYCFLLTFFVPFVVYLLQGQGSWTSFRNRFCLKEIKIEMIRTLRLRIVLNNKYSPLVFISESVCVLENTLSLVLGYYPAVLLLTGTCFFSSLQFRLQLLLKSRPWKEDVSIRLLVASLR